MTDRDLDAMVEEVVGEVLERLKQLQAAGALRGARVTIVMPPRQDPDAALPQPAHGKPKDGEGGAGAAASVGGGEAPAPLTSGPI